MAKVGNVDPSSSKNQTRSKKTTRIGLSSLTRYRSKNDKLTKKKHYRGQGK